MTFLTASIRFFGCAWLLASTATASTLRLRALVVEDAKVNCSGEKVCVENKGTVSVESDSCNGNMACWDNQVVRPVLES